MTETEWRNCTDPTPMLMSLQGKASDRKLRLFAVACHERIFHHLTDKRDCRKTIEFAERFADGLATKIELRGKAWGKPGSVFTVVHHDAWDAAEDSASYAAEAAKNVVLRLDPFLFQERELAFKRAASDSLSFGEAFQNIEMALPKEWIGKGNCARDAERAGQCVLIREIFGPLPFRLVSLDPSWLTTNVREISQAIYDDRAFDHMPILADALMDAGCDSDEIIHHCRSDGPHVRGCWVVDLLLGNK